LSADQFPRIAEIGFRSYNSAELGDVGLNELHCEPTRIGIPHVMVDHKSNRVIREVFVAYQRAHRRDFAMVRGIGWF
jgi:hypothetical protein